ncbi:trypsin-like peptidase domain-containing protein [bacterium]|nr:trypsin-like peptidase domain-containing protein [candidate division CSSED10-310 bacterium]
MKRALLFCVYVLFGVVTVSADRGVPPSMITGLSLVADSSRIKLGLPDIDQWVAEDEMDETAGIPLRIGAFRPVPENSSAWADCVVDVDYGVIWRLAITSPGALEIKLYLTNIKLTERCELFVYREGEAEADRFSRSDVSDDATLWSWGTTGDSVVLEWHHDLAPGETWTDGTPPPFTVQAISHIYRDMVSTMGTREGSCHNDATCDADYINQRDASAYIEFNDGGTYICSGTMLNSAVQSFTPYFLTAHHCISTNTVAASVKAWFFYHTLNCDDPAPDRGYRTVMGGTLLATGPDQGGSGSDFSLLQLNNADYSGVFFAGWDRTALTTGTEVTGIHHPDGAYKRISYGTVRSTGYSGQWGVNWDRTSNPGVTEGGSSGSALFHHGTHRVVGQLWAGSSSCSYQNGRDYYGRFGLSFQNGSLSQWLGNATAVDGAYYNSSNPTPTPPPTATPTPPHSATFTPTPRPTGTYIPTNTPHASWTPTPKPGLTVDLAMSTTLFHPGDSFWCQVLISNNGTSTYPSVALFAVLDIHGNLFFLPDFTDFSYYGLFLPPGQQTIVLIPAFEWPEGAGSAEGIQWYAGITDSGISRLLSNFDTLTFGWTE